jgi:hypothetical protein
MATNDERTYTDVEVWDALSAEHGPAWEASNDYAQRSVDVDAYESTPRVERIRTRKGAAHLPGQPWSSTECLCSCHYGSLDCDERECKAWRTQNARKAAEKSEAKQRRWARKHGRAGDQVGA